MKKLCYKYINIIILFFYLLMFSKLMELCYDIKKFNYIFILLIFFSTILIYFLLSKIRYKRIFISLALIGSLLCLFKYRVFLYAVFNQYIVKNILTVDTAVSKGNSTYFYQFLPLLSVSIPFFITIILLLKNTVYGWISPVLSIIFAASIWFNGGDKFLIKYIFFYVFLVIMDFSVSHYNSLVIKSVKRKYLFLIDKENILKYSVPVALSCAVFVFCAQGIFGIKSIEQRTKKGLVEATTYDLSQSGYSGNATKLGGPIKINENLVMKVKGDKPYYLRGIVKSFYNGHMWQPDEETTSDNTFDKNVKLSKITVYLEKSMNYTFFTPLNTEKIDYGNSNISSNNENIFFTTNYTKINDHYTAYISAEDDLSKGALTSYEKYLQLPDTVTLRTKELVQKITAGTKNNNEKMEAIKNYLFMNYSYSLEVSSVPDKSDFVDYFLFNEKEGYCTYFASAATIMCRLCGIPSRYVEGYNMKDTKDKEGMYQVTSDMAHAWTEVLVSPEKNKWQTFDCVPPSSYEYIRQFMKGSQKNTITAVTPTKAVTQNTINKNYLYFVPAILFLLSIFSFLFFKINKKFIRVKQILCSEDISSLYFYSIQRLKLAGIQMSKCSTDIENINKIQDEAVKQLLLSIVEQYYKEFYGDKNIIVFNRKEYLKRLEIYIRQNSNFFCYYIYKWII